ncbi:FAD-dependent monooxygenase [Kitasatospora sp. NBC_01302]|uniref:FAD-dependent monooxygenase n=1 Tax=Kitasatospora sp. NBC_01302 TaxID=2903575 RepID=UPI002E155EA8|nr:FAD-dependent monooxygenase [Kitasatospora sp. NBC_01302]
MAEAGRTGILVVGAGPVGLTVALELARRGVPIRLIDAAGGPATTSRALATHARTLEVYDQLGVLDAILARGQKVEHFTLHQGGRRLIRFDTDYSALPTRYPFTMMVDQTSTEEVLRNAVAQHGIHVEWGVGLEGFTQDGEGVTATLVSADGTRELVAADWLVGCDGAHSTIRKQLGVPLIGDSSQTWLIADAVVRTTLPRDSIHWLNTGHGTIMLIPFPAPGKWRLLDTVDVQRDADPDAVGARFAAKISAAVGEQVTVETPSWTSVFTIQQRMVESLWHGRCLLAGDAGHVHSPASGQGMNTGIQDAVNLGWKLAMVYFDQASDDLLHSYNSERVPVGRKLLDSTRTATSLVALRNSLMTAFMPAGLALLRAVPPVKRRIERRIMAGMSALDLTYTGSALTRPNPQVTVVRPGARLSRVDTAGATSAGWQEILRELRDPRWLLLLGSNDAKLHAVCPKAGWLGVRTVGGDLPDQDGRLREDLRIGPGDWLLVRPDGYVAGRGQGAHSLRAELSGLALTAEPHQKNVVTREELA